jgi:5-methylcytosine-specific restriction endonuclease McrA
MAENTKQHSEQTDAYRRRAIVRKERTDGFKLADSERRELWKRQFGKCPCCAKPIPSMWEAEVDHIIPVARGGKDNISNIMLTHQQCNREKHNKTLKEHWDWRVRVGLDRVSLRNILYGDP